MCILWKQACISLACQNFVNAEIHATFPLSKFLSRYGTSFDVLPSENQGCEYCALVSNKTLLIFQLVYFCLNIIM